MFLFSDCPGFNQRPGLTIIQTRRQIIQALVHGTANISLIASNVLRGRGCDKDLEKRGIVVVFGAVVVRPGEETPNLENPVSWTLYCPTKLALEESLNYLVEASPPPSPI